MTGKRLLTGFIAGLLLVALSSCSASTESSQSDSTCVWDESTWNNCKLGT